MTDATATTATRPYLIRALYEWCTDNGFTPQIAVTVNDRVQVPREYVKNGEIVLNISFGATSALQLGNDFIEFKGRFAGTARDIMIPVGQVTAIYARENGQGMAFPLESPAGERSTRLTSAPTGKPQDAELVAAAPVKLTRVESERREPDAGEEPEPPRSNGGPRPTLTRVK
jgi:stringent starvation protein B